MNLYLFEDEHIVTTDNRIVAKPLLKWAGGKSQLLDEIDSRLPIELKNGYIKNYCEPFLGGAAVYFYIAQKYSIDKAILSDVNEEIILFYQVIKNDVNEFLESVNYLKNTYLSLNSEKQTKFFYDIRKQFNQSKKDIDFNHYDKNWIERAAQLLFLNKTCYNGLFRQNSKGEFNVPFGKYRNPQFFDIENVLLTSKLLQKAELLIVDFENIEKFVDDSFFVYFDPPYRPISKTSSFTSYSKFDFNDNEQVRLAELFKRLDKKRAKLMLSNSDPKNVNPEDEFFEKLYSKFRIERVLASRMINCNGNGRGKINELIIMNY